MRPKNPCYVGAKLIKRPDIVQLMYWPVVGGEVSKEFKVGPIATWAQATLDLGISIQTAQSRFSRLEMGKIVDLGRHHVASEDEQ
jgi:hypothetical protein